MNKIPFKLVTLNEVPGVMAYQISDEVRPNHGVGACTTECVHRIGVDFDSDASYVRWRAGQGVVSEIGVADELAFVKSMREAGVKNAEALVAESMATLHGVNFNITWIEVIYSNDTDS